MKKTKRGAKRIFVTMLAVMLVMESVSVPAKGEVQTESIRQQTLGESVDKYAEESVSANFDTNKDICVLCIELYNIVSGISVAHYPELCMAWMDSIPEEILLKQKSYRNVYVNCPVDIYVYEGENLVGCIKNDVPQHIENGVITMMDSNGQKQVVLPGDGEYRVVCKATGDGAIPMKQ